MKRRFTAFVVALLGAVSAFAQPEAGTFSLTPKVGITGASTGDLYGTTHNFSSDFKLDANSIGTVGFVAGVEAGYQVSKKFAVTAGLLYSQQGTERDAAIPDYHESSISDKSKLNLDYLNIPILANVYLFKGFAVKAGIQPGILLSAKDKANQTATGVFAEFDDHEELDLKSYCNKIDFAIPVGISYEFYNVIIDARYNFGVTNILKDDKIGKDVENGKNGVFQLTVGYKFCL